MNRAIHIGLAVAALSFVPALAVAEEASTSTTIRPGAPAFPANERCTTNSPCTSVAGEITRIEESYWIRTPSGGEVHLKVSGDSHLKELPKVGDNVAAQLDSTGNVQALMKMKEPATPPKGQVPSKTLEDLR